MDSAIQDMAKNSPYPRDKLPSYSESISDPQPSSATLRQNITQARCALVSSLLTTHISPHLYSNSLSGLSNTTLLLVPSNVSSLQPPSHDAKDPFHDGPTFRGESIEGFYTAENLTIVRLQGQENSIEFWRQPAVIRELGQQLQVKLRKDGHRIAGDADVARVNFPTTKARGGLFKKKPVSTEMQVPKGEAQVEGEISTEVEIQDICLRIQNEMGLYKTRNGKAMVIKVDAGG